MNNQRPMFINILLVVLLFLVVGSLFSAVVGIVGSLLWLAVKILVPVAIIVWLVRTNLFFYFFYLKAYTILLIPNIIK